MNEKYTELIKEIARIITDGERERLLLQLKLNDTKMMLEEAEARIAELEKAKEANKNA